MKQQKADVRRSQLERPAHHRTRQAGNVPDAELPDAWAWVSPDELASDALHAICIGPFGSSLVKSDYRESGVPIVFVKDIRRQAFGGTGTVHVDHRKAEELSAHLVHPGNVLITKMGDPPGDAAIYPFDQPTAVITADCIKLDVDTRLSSSKYVLHCLKSNVVRAQIESITKGVAHQKVSLERFRGLALPVAPLQEQRRIVAKIDSLSGKSKRARDHLDHVPRLVEKYKQAILGAELRRGTNGSESIPLDTQLVHLTSGSRDWAQYYDRGQCVFVLAGNVSPMAFDTTPKRLVDPPLSSSDAKRSKIAKDDLLITIVGAGTGDLCRVPSEVENYFVCQSVALLRLADPASAQFYELWFNSDEFGRKDIHEVIYGAARPHLSFDQIRSLLVPRIDDHSKAEIVRRIRTAFAWIDRLASEATSARKLIDHLDQAILSKAFRGELVPKDPNDEPASVVLERIRGERSVWKYKSKGKS